MSHHHAGTETISAPHPSARFVFVPAVPDAASIGREQANAPVINTNEWYASIYQDAFTPASVTAHRTSGTLAGRFRQLKGHGILRCLWRYSDETLKPPPDDVTIETTT
jgi:hypothetical protein